MARVGDLPVQARAGEMECGSASVGRWSLPIGLAVEGDRGYRDGGLFGQLFFDLLVLGEPRGQAEPVAEEVDHHVHEVVVVERRGGALECGVVSNRHEGDRPLQIDLEISRLLAARPRRPRSVAK